MTQVMTPSSITAGQIGKIQDLLGAGLRKSGLQSEPTQEVIETQGDLLVVELVAAVRRRVEAVSKMITRPFKVDRTKTPAELLVACKRTPWYIDEKVLALMPMDGPEEGELVFFPLERYVSVVEIPGVLDTHGLVPDYAAQMQVNADDPAFADEHPNGMQWDKNCCAAFRRGDSGRGVGVSRGDRDWGGTWWFAGRRK